MSYKLELHAHSKSVSACSSTPEEMVAQLYIDAGYDGIVLSNHYSSYTLHHFLKGESFEANVNTYIDAARKVREAARESSTLFSDARYILPIRQTTIFFSDSTRTSFITKRY